MVTHQSHKTQRKKKNPDRTMTIIFFVFGILSQMCSFFCLKCVFGKPKLDRKDEACEHYWQRQLNGIRLIAKEASLREMEPIAVQYFLIRSYLPFFIVIH
jgi:hypothetical protein